MKIETFQFNPVQENTYVLYDETGECVIIDAGCYSQEEEEALSKFIANKKLRVKHLLNTHLHFDHVLGNTFVKNTFDLDTKAHKGDQFLLDGLPTQMQLFGFPPIEKVPIIGELLDEGDSISFGNQQLDVLHVPGHSPGSIVFHNSKTKDLFVGDVLFKLSVGRTDLLGGNHTQLIDGIRTKLLTLPPETTVYSGHGPTTSIGEEARNNPYL